MFTNSICWLVDADGNGRARTPAVVDPGRTRRGMDGANPRQLASDGPNSIGPRRDQRSEWSDPGAKPRELRSGFLSSGNGEGLSRAFRLAPIGRTSRHHQRDAEGREGTRPYQDCE